MSWLQAGIERFLESHTKREVMREHGLGDDAIITTVFERTEPWRREAIVTWSFYPPGRPKTYQNLQAGRRDYTVREALELFLKHGDGNDENA